MIRLDPPVNCRTTDHAEEIQKLRNTARIFARMGVDITDTERTIGMAYDVAADLLEAHDQTGLSLDNWGSARRLVEHLLDLTILENGV